MSATETAVELLGGQSATADKLSTEVKKVKQNNVSYWVNRHKQTPAKYIRKLSELTNGEVTVDELLADHEKNHQAKLSNKKEVA